MPLLGQSKFTGIARALLKIARHEMAEIEICSECYLRSAQPVSADWFAEPCSLPHTLCWAKMKGYQPWPAKVLRIVNDEVDVRFFGQHDRSVNDRTSSYWLRSGLFFLGHGYRSAIVCFCPKTIQVSKRRNPMPILRKAWPNCNPISIDWKFCTGNLPMHHCRHHSAKRNRSNSFLSSMVWLLIQLDCTDNHSEHFPSSRAFITIDLLLSNQPSLSLT